MIYEYEEDDFELDSQLQNLVQQIAFWVFLSFLIPVYNYSTLHHNILQYICAYPLKSHWNPISVAFAEKLKSQVCVNAWLCVVGIILYHITLN